MLSQVSLSPIPLSKSGIGGKLGLVKFTYHSLYSREQMEEQVGVIYLSLYSLKDEEGKLRLIYTQASPTVNLYIAAEQITKEDAKDCISKVTCI